MNHIEVNPEYQFMKDAHKSFIVSIGMKRRGKSYLMMQYVKHCLLNNVFEHYHIVLPQFGHERSGMYQFLNNFKGKVTIYNRYHEIITKNLVKELGAKKNFFGIDDATGELLGNNDPYFNKLITCNEHGGAEDKCCCIWICVHAAKKVMTPLARAMLNYLFVYHSTNQALVHGIWEEYFSLRYPTYKDFLQVYESATSRELPDVGGVNAIMFATSGHHDLNGVLDWELANNKFEELDKVKSKAKAKIREIDVEKERILSKEAFKEKVQQVKNEYYGTSNTLNFSMPQNKSNKKAINLGNFF